MEETGGMTLKELMDLIRRNLKMVLALAIAGLVLSGVAVAVNVSDHITQPRYSAQMSLAVVSQNVTGGFGRDYNSPGNEDVNAARNMTQTAAYICTGDQVINAALSKMGAIGITYEDVVRELTAEAKKDSQIIVLTLNWEDPDEAVQILASIADVVPDVLIESLKLGNATIVDSPKIVSGNFNLTKQVMLLFIGLVAGLFIAVVILVLRDMLHPTLVDPSSVRNEFGVKLFGTIPDNGDMPLAIESIQGPLPSLRELSFQETYMTTAHIVSHFMRTQEEAGKKRPHIIYVTSSVEQEGKSTLISRLAIEMAKEWNVLLVDCDLVAPTIAPMFLEDVDPKRTLNGVIVHGTKLSKAITRVKENLSVLPALVEEDRLYVDARVIDKIDEAAQGFDLVLVDTPPVGQDAEAMALNRIADGALFVIRYDYVSVQSIKSSLNALEHSGTNVLGAVVNKVNLRYFGELTRYSRYSGAVAVDSKASLGARQQSGGKPESVKRGLFGKRSRNRKPKLPNRGR